MKINELISDLAYINSIPFKDREIKQISFDSRLVEKDSLFVAIKGFNYDGHNFVKQAISSGAVYAIVEYFVDGVDRNLQILVPDSRIALLKISERFFNFPFRNLLMIGITGTNGKSTTSYLIKSILETAKIDTGLIGTIKYIFKNSELSPTHTTPEAPILLHWLNENLKKGMTACVMEVSSHSLELNRVSPSWFDIAVFTNLSQDHLDFHHNFDNYRNAKLKLFRELGMNNNKKINPIAIINLDDENSEYFINSLSTKYLTYGFNKNSDISPVNCEFFPDKTRISIKCFNNIVNINSNLIGKFNVLNILSAFSVGYSLKIKNETIVEGIESLKNIPGRFERIDLGQPFFIFIDYAHTPDALKNAIVSLKSIYKGRLIVVFGCGGDRDKTKRPVMGRIVSELADVPVVTSDNPRTENPDDIIRDIAKGMNGNEIIIPDRKEAIAYALNIAKKDDVVLIAGKGHEDYQIIGNKKIHFSDRETVKDILSSNV